MYFRIITGIDRIYRVYFGVSMTGDSRIVRVPLPVDLIRQMDQLILSGRGGFQTRAEFIREAIEAQVLEASYEPAPEEPTALERSPAEAGAEVPGQTSNVDGQTGQASTLKLEDTKLGPVHRGYQIENGVAEVADEPLFGLHNRDYPSLWAAYQIASLTEGGSREINELLEEVTRRAWHYADGLSALETARPQKLTALFPTNKKKPQTASAGFRDFAIGRFANNGGGVTASGPLFVWKICQFQASAGQLAVGVTTVGYDLLESLSGISLALPHSTVFAERFLGHLKRESPSDLWGITTVLECAGEGANRTDLCRRFSEEHTDWGATTASNYASGYVARCREWGLLEPKLAGGRYVLTEFGKEHLHGTGETL